ncbi:hypothetical protein [Fimbriiglobus ruber]|uniref:Uncharacterized protein n=1 Tax=Fimbriiglobus ruber TaxID=1908690 RepID=A0A225DAA3_9BACT|nr:hypothetical protein [Fimbriiglobus ruber]OWK34226.1 hypothetical protein FRUB_10197 [Fimbriiglobus ruber]
MPGRGTAWSPVGAVLGVAPAAPVPPPPPDPRPSRLMGQPALPVARPVATVLPQGGATPTGPAPATARTPVVVRVLFALGLIGVGYLGYEVVRRPTPREVFDRFNRADTADEACRCTTPRFAPFVRGLFADPTGDPAAEFEVTRDGPAPAAVGGHWVEFHGRYHDPDVGRRVAVDGYFQLVDRDGWAIDDMVFRTFDGRVIDPPASVAATLPPPPAGGATPPAGPPRLRNLGWVPLAIKGVIAWAGKSAGLKALVAAAVAVAAGFAAWARRAVRPVSPPGPENRPG